jgi:flagellar protein FliO/FliZ
VTPALLARLGGPRRAAALAGGAALGVAALSLSTGALAPAAARAAVAVCALAALAVLVRGTPRATAGPARLVLVSRAALSRDAGLAFVEADGRRLLVGYGEGGVRLVADLSADAPPGGTP